MKKINEYKITYQANMSTIYERSIIVRAKTALKAQMLAMKKLQDKYFYVGIIKTELIMKKD